MTAIRKPPADQPSLVLIDLLDKHRGTGAYNLANVQDAVRYIARVMSPKESTAEDLKAISKYIARDGAAWVRGVNFICKEFDSRIKELQLATEAPVGRGAVPFGVLVLSTSKNDRPPSEQMAKMKRAAFRTLRHLGVERNRAFLAIHDDTEKLHLHIIYSRYDAHGRLTEREAGRFRRYLMEDVCARVAFDVGYNLEDGAKTRPNSEGELVDRVSGQIIRTAEFEPVLEGCKARNRERRKTKTGHKLEEIALGEYRRSDTLNMFRGHLAEHGVAYVNKGSGAVFVDADGINHKASKVNYIFSRGRIFDGAYKDGLPPEPEFVKDFCDEARRTRRIGDGATGKDAPTYPSDCPLTDAQRVEADRRIRRGYSDAPCGRPAKLNMDQDWPQGFPRGGIRIPSRPQNELKADGVKAVTRGYHIELWRNDRLIAVQLKDEIVVYSRDKEDLRTLLLAAHKQWGTVQINGNTAFKKRVADLAAELGIPIANRELQGRISHRRLELAASKRKSPSWQAATSVRLGAERPSPGVEDTGAAPTSKLDVTEAPASKVAPVNVQVPESAPKNNAVADLEPTSTLDSGHASTQSVVSSGNSNDGLGSRALPAASVSDTTNAVPRPEGSQKQDATVKSQGRSVSSNLDAPTLGNSAGETPLQQSGGRGDTVDLPSSTQDAISSEVEVKRALAELAGSNAFVALAGSGAQRFRLQANATCRTLIDPILHLADVQLCLATLYRKQHADLDALAELLQDPQVEIRNAPDPYGRGAASYQLEGLHGLARDLYRKYQRHLRCNEILESEHQRRERERQLARQATTNESMAVGGAKLPLHGMQIEQAPAASVAHRSRSEQHSQTAPVEADFNWHSTENTSFWVEARVTLSLPALHAQADQKKSLTNAEVAGLTPRENAPRPDSLDAALQGGATPAQKNCSSEDDVKAQGQAQAQVGAFAAISSRRQLAVSPPQTGHRPTLDGAEAFSQSIDVHRAHMGGNMAESAAAATKHSSADAASGLLESKGGVPPLEADRQGQPLTGESSAPARRTIAVTPEPLGRVAGQPAKVDGMVRTEFASAARTSRLVEVESYATASSRLAATASIQPNAPAPFGSLSADERSHDLPVGKHLVAKDRMDGTPASGERQKPLNEPLEPTVASTEVSCLSLLPGKVVQPTSVKSLDYQAETAKLTNLDATGTLAKTAIPFGPLNTSNGNFEDQMKVAPEEDDGAAAPISYPARIHAILTQEEIRDTLKPRRLGGDEVVKPSDKPEALDPITAAKLLWVYDDLSLRARAKLSRADKELYAEAVKHPLAKELRAALVRGRSSHRTVSGDTKLMQAGQQSQPAHVQTNQDKAKHATHQRQAALLAQQGRGGI